VTFFQVLIVLAVVGGVAAVAAGRVRGGLPAPTTTLPEVDRPADHLGTRDVDAVRFSVGFRGYRMDEVDAVLDRLGLELGAREEEIRELREQLYGGGPEQVVSEPASEPVSEPAGGPVDSEPVVSDPAQVPDQP
jgi:DivIVA domain-containing protein